MTRTKALLEEISRKGSTRATIALVYGQGITLCRVSGNLDAIDWPAVNRALLQRYTVSGLLYIKTRAWHLSMTTHPPSTRV